MTAEERAKAMFDRWQEGAFDPEEAMADAVETIRAAEADVCKEYAPVLDLLAEAFAEPSCDGEEGLKDGLNCISCRAVALLKAAGRQG
jgi:hypothetical protein